MPSTFRSSRSGRQFDNNRTRNGQIDHDVFEGLPVRRWSRQPHTHSQAPKTEDSEFVVQGPGGIGRLPELAMPRDSQLLGAGSRALLRAARAGCIHIHQNTRIPDKDEKEGEGDDGATGSHSADRSFTSRKWTTLPKQLEPADVEFLAKRRPGLPSLYGGSAAVDGSGSGPGPMRRTKFQKTDPTTGKISIYEAWVPEGHRIEGEITGDIQTIAAQSDGSVNSEMPAPGTVVEGVGVVNSEGVVIAEAGSASVMTPPKRRPPPPKRKGKGIGKGRKKKVMFAPGEGADAATVHNVSSGVGALNNGSKEGQQAVQMPIDQSGQEDDEDGEDGEEGEDGEDGDDGDDSDEADDSVMDAKTPEPSQVASESADHPTASTPAESKDVEMTDAAFEPQPSDARETSISEQGVASGPPSAPVISSLETHRNETEPHAAITSTSIPEAIEPTDASTEQLSDSNEQPPRNLESQEPPTESTQPETSTDFGVGAVLQEQSRAPEYQPSTESKDLEAVATEPSQATTDAALSEAQTKIESNVEDTLATCSADQEPRAEDHSVPPTESAIAPESAMTEVTHTAPDESKPIIASVPETEKHEESVPVTLEKDSDALEVKEEPHKEQSPAASGQGDGPAQVVEPTTAEHSEAPPLFSSLASTEPSAAIDTPEPSDPPATEKISEVTNSPSNPDPVQPTISAPASTEAATMQEPAATESESAPPPQEETKENTESSSGPVPESA